VIDRFELTSCGQLIRTDSTAVPVSQHLFGISQYNNGSTSQTGAHAQPHIRVLLE
jgi:hypothetical protein